MNEIKRSTEQGIKPEARKILFGPWLDDWLSRHEVSVREGTATCYRQLARLITASLRQLPITQLSASDLERLYASRLTTHAPNTVLHLHRLLHEALKRAMREEVVSRNVTETADAPRVPRQEVRTLAEPQVFAMLAAAEDDR